MQLRDFARSGHWPTLLCAFLYFDISFMVWVIFGPLAPAIIKDIPLSPASKGLLVAVPILGGAILRLPLGVLADRIGGRRVGLLGLTLTVIPLLLGWLWADSYEKLLLVGGMLGVAGASFAVALPLASRWYPPQYQGLALGIAGAGNSGTALATLFAPWLASVYGWHLAFAVALVPILVVLLLFFLMAKDSPNQPAPKPLADYALVLKQPDAWWFCLFYSVTFGGFVGLASFLNLFFTDQYALQPVEAGMFATLCVVSGSFLRPLGGYLADRFGGIRMLTALYLAVGVVMVGVAALPPLHTATALLFVGMGMLGMGNGAVFQLVPQRFPKEIGVITGVVGAAGGVGGFFLPTLLGSLKQMSGSYAGGFLAFALVGFASAVVLVYVSRSWQATFVTRGGLATAARA